MSSLPVTRLRHRGAEILALVIGQERPSGGTCIFNNSLSVKRLSQIPILDISGPLYASSFANPCRGSTILRKISCRPFINPQATTYPSKYFQPANMADASGDAKPTPAADQTASSDLKPAVDETKLATNPLGDESKEAPASDAQTSTVTETASATAANVASTASAAATGVKDSVFSMFGGGAKKEKKEDEDDDAKNEPSGSSKVKKDDDDDVSDNYRCDSKTY